MVERLDSGCGRGFAKAFACQPLGPALAPLGSSCCGDGFGDERFGLRGGVAAHHGPGLYLGARCFLGPESEAADHKAARTF